MSCFFVCCELFLVSCSVLPTHVFSPSRCRSPLRSSITKHALFFNQLFICQTLSKVFEVSTFGLHVYWEP